MKKSLKNLKILLLLSGFFALTSFSYAQSTSLKDIIQGNWQGKLDAGAAKLTLVLKVVASSDHQLQASLDSPDQGARDIKVSSIDIQGDSLFFASTAVMGKYSGKWEAATRQIKGIWRQAGLNLELNLEKTDKLQELKRPQQPQPPYPYQSEEITFKNQNGKISLAGTLTLPEGNGPFPACILVSGSGPQNRDSEIMGHKPFLVLADYLTRKGYAVLRYDDRGTGSSGGNFSTATTLDFATDAKAAFDFLRSDNRIISSKIGIIGHSEGGIIAPIVATQNLATAFIILLAGSAIPGEDILFAQQELISKAEGVNEDDIKTNLKMNRELFSILKKTPDTADAAKKLRAVLEKESSKSAQMKAMNEETRDKFIDMQVSTLNGAWFRTFLTLDPADYLQQVRCPVLALFAEKDLQVPPDLNVKALKKALTKAGNADYQVVELPGLNHLFQKAKTGSPNEYGNIEETISPKVLEIISSWLALKTK